MKHEVTERHYMGARARLLDVAAFLDRLERAEGEEDFRTRSFRACLPILTDEQPDKARRILELLSDPTSDPVEKAPGKSAAGAWPGFSEDA